jgi:hypothetical protein
VPDGVYGYTIDAVDDQSNRTELRGSVMVDTRKPLSLASPTPGTTLAGTAALTAVQLADYSLTTYFYGTYAYWFRADGGSGFIDYLHQQSDGTWTGSWDTNTVLNGSYEIRIYTSYSDSRGGYKSLWTPVGSVTVDNGIAIRDATDNPDSFSPNADNQSDVNRISYTLSKDARLTVKVYDSADALVRTVLNNQAQSSGYQYADWDGKNAARLWPMGSIPTRLMRWTIWATRRCSRAGR